MLPNDAVVPDQSKWQNAGMIAAHKMQRHSHKVHCSNNKRQENMSVLSEFKEFAIKGNMVDMAVGIIIGVAFGKIVSSLVNDIIMPPLGLAIGGMDFSDLAVVLKEAAGEEIAAVTLNYGAFLQSIIDFLIVAMAIFVAVKAINRMQRKEEEKPAAPPEPSEEVLLLRDIRDTLKKNP
jgi:large conductance mechanosensitive channel